MIPALLRSGIQAARRRPGLVVLLYGVDLLVAAALALPLPFFAVREVEPSGFGADLAASFDLVLWSGAAEAFGEAAAQSVLLFLAALPFFLVWRAVLGVGLTQALRDGGTGSFGQGVRRFAPRGLLLALFYGLLGLCWSGACLVLALLLGSSLQGERGLFWSLAVFVPLLWMAGLALLDLMHDYARAALVVEGRGAVRAGGTGLAWPFRRALALPLYLSWLGAAVLLLALSAGLDMTVTAATPFTVAALFLAQQLLLVLRAGVSVAWVGSQVAFYEQVRPPEPEPEPVEDGAPPADPPGDPERSLPDPPGEEVGPA